MTLLSIETATPASETRIRRALMLLAQPAVYCTILALSLLVLVPAMIGSPFVVHIFVTICVFAALSTAWNIVGGYAGQLSLGHALFYGIGGYVTVLLTTHLALSPWIGMWIGAVVSVMVGVAIGYPCFRLRGPYFGLATIAFLEVARLLVIHFHTVTGGAAGLVVPLNLGWKWMIFREKFNYLYIAFGLLLLCLAVSWLVRNSRLGFSLTAVRERDDAALACGVSNMGVKLKAIALSAGLTSLVGSFHAVYITFLEPGTLFSLPMSIEIAMFALIGGLGTVTGPLFGTLLVVPLAELARGWLGASANGLHGFVYGAVLVVITLTLPGGLVEAFGQRVMRLVNRLPGARVAPARREAAALRRIEGEKGDPVIVATNLTLKFGGVAATDNLSLTVRRGEILGIIGPNGAGKTTLFNQLSGFLRPDQGTVSIVSAAGVASSPRGPDMFAREGLGRTFQIVQPFGKLTVLENVMMGAFMRHPQIEDARAVALLVCRMVELDGVVDVEARHLPIGGLKRLEVARALATEPSVLLLDEVMAGQSAADTQRMVQLIRSVRDTGVTVVAIEHNMQAIMSLSDRIAVIDQGRLIAEGAPQEVVKQRRVIEAYLGEEFADAQGF